VNLSIDGMHCGGCVRRVTTALQRVKGVELGAVEVGLAQMIFNPEETNTDKIVASVDRIGFTAHVES
jgi:copper chaperone